MLSISAVAKNRCALVIHVRRLSSQSSTLKADDVDETTTISSRPYQDLPGPKTFDIITGFLPGGKFRNKSFTDYMRQLRSEYGDIYHIPGLFGKTDIVVTYSADDFRKIFRADGVWPIRPGMESMKYYRKTKRPELYGKTEGLISAQGKEWGDFRTAVNPILMEPNNAKAFVKSLQEVNSDFIQRIRDIRDPVTLEVPENFVDEINRQTFESVFIVSFNKQLGLIRKNRDKANAKELFQSLQKFLQLIYDLDFQPSIWKYVRTPAYVQYQKNLDVIYETVTAFVEEALQRYERENRASLPDNELSLLEKLLKIDKTTAIVMVIDLLMAGVDTTTSTMTGILLEVAKNPDKQSKLREEIRQFLPTKDSTFTAKTLRNLPYLRACIKEGIRMHPIVPGIMRVLGEDLILQGYQVPKGTNALLCLNELQREERYFHRPNEFLPERWLRNDNLANTITPFTYLPFGFGPRMCAGRRIIDMELEVTVARLVRNFYMEFNYPIENAFVSYLINTPGIPLKFKFTETED